MVIQNYPKNYVGNIKYIPQTTTNTNIDIQVFNKNDFIREKKEQGYIQQGDTLIKYITQKYKTSEGKTKTKELIIEKIELTDKGYIKYVYDIFERENKSPIYKLVKTEIYENDKKIYEEIIYRDTYGNKTEKVRTDYIKGVEKTKKYPTDTPVFITGDNPNDRNKAFEGENILGIIITNKDKGESRVYDISQGYDKPILIGVTKTPIITQVGNVASYIGDGKITISEKIPTVNIPSPINNNIVYDSKGLGYSVAPELQEQFIKKIEQAYNTDLINSYDMTKQTIPKDYTIPASDINLDKEALESIKKGGVINTAGGLTIGAISFIGGVGTSILYTPEFFSPITYKGDLQIPIITPLYNFGKSIYTGDFYKTYTEKPAYTTGTIIGGYIGGRLVNPTIQGIKGIYVKTGAEYIPENTIFSKQVLEEGQKFPTVTSTKETISQIEQANNLVVTASPEKLKGTQAGMGGRAQAGLEDAGIYVTALGEGSPQFLGTSGYNNPKFTLNPFKPFSNILKQPQVTIFETQGVSYQPEVVLKKAGFEATKEFFENVGSKTGKVYITKRSMIGQGELTPQEYTLPSGKKILEQGTTEGETIIPYKAEFEYNTPKTILGEIKGYDYYTIDPFTKQPIPVRKADLLKINQETSTSNIINVNSKTTTNKYISDSNLKSGSYYTMSVMPYSYTPVSSKTSINNISYSNDYLNSSPNYEQPLRTTSYNIIEKTYDFEKQPYDEKITSKTTNYYFKNDNSYDFTNIIRDYNFTDTTKTDKTNIDIFDIKNIISEDKKKKDKKVKLYVRKKGKFELRGVFETPSEAFKRGITETSTTARASFKMIPEGETKPIKPSETLPLQFGTSKKDEFVIVQKAPYRISSLGEKLELQRARKQKRYYERKNKI